MTTLFPMQMLSSAQKANIEAMRAMTLSMINAAERVTALHLDVSRSAIEYALKGSPLLRGQSWSGTAPRPEIDLRPLTDKTMAYFRGMQEISSEAQEEITQVLASRAGEASGAMVAILDNIEHAAPASVAPAVAAVRSVIVKTHSAYDNMLKAGKQVAAANTLAVAKATSAMSAASTAGSARMKKAA